MAASPNNLDPQIVKHIDSLLPSINRVITAMNEYYHLTCDSEQRHLISLVYGGTTTAPYFRLGLRPHHGAEERKLRTLLNEEGIRLNVREDEGGWGVDWKKLNQKSLGELAHRVEAWVGDARAKQLDAGIVQKAGELAKNVDTRVRNIATDDVPPETIWLHIVRKSKTVPRSLKGDVSSVMRSREGDEIELIARLIDNSVGAVDARRHNNFWDHLLQASKTAGKSLKSQSNSPSLF